MFFLRKHDLLTRLSALAMLTGFLLVAFDIFTGMIPMGAMVIIMIMIVVSVAILSFKKWEK